MGKGIIGHLAFMCTVCFGAMGNNTPSPVTNTNQGRVRNRRERELDRLLAEKPEPPLSHGKQKFLINGQVIYAISEKHAIRKFKKKTGFTINTIENVKE